MKYLVVLASVLAAASAVSFFEVLMEEWEGFKLTHAKKYNDPTEEKFRMKIFMENKHKIAKHNQQFSKGSVRYQLAMNRFGDLLHHEFVGLMNGFMKGYNKSHEDASTYLSPHNVKVPEAIDWREKGYVTPIKDQGQCGSCWSFSATGALEGQHRRKLGKLVSLSEQNLIDCSKKYGNEGCNGGLMDNAFRYIKENKGLDTEDGYPYEATEGSCRFKRSTIGALDTGFMDLPQGDEEKLKEAVGTVGPVSVAIDASHESFQFYSTGVYSEPQCSSEELDHGVLVVGYGTEDGQDFWLVKNSWGTTWGEKGFVKMTRNQDNQCGIASQASYPLV